MINIFYANGTVWAGVLFLYLLGWSDLCTNIDIGLLVFILVDIIISFILGFIFRKEMKFMPIEEKYNKKSKVTMMLVIFFIIDIIYEKRVPILEVLNGVPYGEVIFSGIPLIHNVISSFAIFYSIYLSYRFFCFKNKKLLIENCIIFLFFIILVQRQNILICLVMFCNIWLSTFLSEKIKKNKKIIIVLLIISIIILYLFGIFGNMRYGSQWAWNDSSMIVNLARMNDKYPEFIPLEYFWSYSYIVTPLANLNYNIINFNSTDSVGEYLVEYVPEFISSRLSLERASVKLPVASLNATTAYSRAYVTYGYFGMYIMLFLQIGICTLITCFTYKNNRKYFVVVCCALEYFLLFAFFDNTFVYTITAFMLIYSFICSLGIKLKL